MIRIAIVGAGGINSWVIHHLMDIVKLFEKEKLIYVKIFDDDIVEEKNLKRKNQNFIVEDLMLKKAEVLAKRYNVDFENTLITEETIHKLTNFTDVIVGVDNHITRRLLYKYCLEEKKYLLDLRANSTQLAYYLLNHDKPWEYYEETHFSNKELMEKKGGCQLEEDIEKDHIESGNKIMAYMGMWGIFLKRLRDEEPSTDEYKFVY